MDSRKENGRYYLGFGVGDLGFQGSVGDAGLDDLHCNEGGKETPTDKFPIPNLA